MCGSRIGVCECLSTGKWIKCEVAGMLVCMGIRLGGDVWESLFLLQTVSNCCVCWGLAQRVVSQSWGVYSCVLRMFGVRCIRIWSLRASRVYRRASVVA